MSRPARPAYAKFYKLAALFSVLVSAGMLAAGGYRCLFVEQKLPPLAVEYQTSIKQLFENKEFAIAVDQLKIAAAIDQDHWEWALINLKTAARRANDLDNEIYALRQMTDLGIATASDSYQLSAALLKRNAGSDDLKDAAREGVRALNLNLEPEIAKRAHLNVAIACISLRKLGTAETHLRAALAIDADFAPAKQQLARIGQYKSQLEAGAQQ